MPTSGLARQPPEGVALWEGLRTIYVGSCAMSQ